MRDFIRFRTVNHNDKQNTLLYNFITKSYHHKLLFFTNLILSFFFSLDFLEQRIYTTLDDS